MLTFVFISVALAMDCFSVSLACGLVDRRMGRQAVAMAVLFGFFQGAMPLLGWGSGVVARQYVSAFDTLACLLLLALGAKMVADGIRHRERQFNPSSFPLLLLFALATSIDALVVGVSFPAFGVLTLADALLPVAIIGAGSFLFSLLGKGLGVAFGRRIPLRPDLLAGTLLIIIALKTLCF